MDKELMNFFNSYDFFVKCLMINGYDNKYQIIVDKKIMSDNTRVNISITSNLSDSEIMYNNFIVLNNSDSDKLIDMIRDNFTSNYDIVFGAIDSINNMQFFYMDNFTLYIGLYNEEEYNKAFMYNRRINARINKRRVLIK